MQTLESLKSLNQETSPCCPQKSIDFCISNTDEKHQLGTIPNTWLVHLNFCLFVWIKTAEMFCFVSLLWTIFFFMIRGGKILQNTPVHSRELPDCKINFLAKPLDPCMWAGLPCPPWCLIATVSILQMMSWLEIEKRVFLAFNVGYCTPKETKQNWWLSRLIADNYWLY